MESAAGTSMNLKQFAENLGIEQDEFLELIELFWETSTTDLSKVGSAIASGDREAAVDAAHSIKGAAASLGLMEIYEAAKQMESDARQDRLSRVAEATDVLKEGLDRLAKSLTKVDRK
jgi:histidine phosphotransfer protein HptB